MYFRYMNARTSALTMGIIATLFACGQGKSSSVATDVSASQLATKPVENIVPTKDQVRRRAVSEAYCTSKGIPIYRNPNSLFVDPEKRIHVRTHREVVDRALALLYVGLKSEGLAQKLLDSLDKEYTISSKLSPRERLYASEKHPSEQTMIDANWRYESLHVMLWALGFIDTLSYPDHMCDVEKDVQNISSVSEHEFRRKARLRTKSEILDQADLILRLNWACTSARLKNMAAPSGLDAGVVQERHHSLNWLIRYLNADWDDVRTDT